MSQRLTQLSEVGKEYKAGQDWFEENLHRFPLTLSQWNPIIHFTLSSRSVNAGSKMLSQCASMYCLPKNRRPSVIPVAQIVSEAEFTFPLTASGADVADCQGDLVSSEGLSHFLISISTLAELEDCWWKYQSNSSPNRISACKQSIKKNNPCNVYLLLLWWFAASVNPFNLVGNSSSLPVGPRPHR